ncbi:MAG: bifunctional demethylmenaquinone methyltransferase/2-methoxy-6-polyprenyl-1,4-benzoquinol methylase UbiE [Paludibacteraceae bacterium]|nr:bifunctional demethylmenaquinone methyltransferase/2-methoxy-6-polyprenyl-1,4-benzoquinol methylase UbiE [Paludibacteraceae bacterium]
MMQEKKTIGALFDRIAASYDSLNHILSLGIDRAWRRNAVREMRPVSALLDVAVGTADLTLEVLKQQKAKRILGIDLSEKMMEVGRSKIQKEFPNADVTFQKASAFDIPFPDNSFGAVTCAFGVRNFSDLDCGLEQMYRVLENGGELMILELSYPSSRLLAWWYDLYFSHILPRVGGCLSRDRAAYNYLNRSVKHFIWGEEMCQHLRNVGFSQVTFTPLTFGIATVYRAFK